MRRWRESYQRMHPAQYIADRYAGQRYVVLACDSDEVPRRQVVADLRGALYARAADGLYLEMHFLYYNFRRAAGMREVGWRPARSGAQARQNGQSKVPLTSTACSVSAWQRSLLVRHSPVPEEVARA